jgi:UDP-N-acetylglucosamine--N-acetylmuramyl-(pentapeptide) pyrophosphoryl-undecaprenol N-acetylglucosamine transferase
LCEELKKIGYSLYFITDKRGEKFIQNNSKKLFKKILIIPASGFSGKNIFQKILSLLRVSIGFFITAFWVIKYNPKLTIGFGGYTTIPVIISSKLLLKKTVIHSADAVMGLSNKVLSYFSNTVCTSFKKVNGIPNFAQKKVIFTSLPIEKIFYKYAKEEYPQITKKSDINILITGGSLSAKALSIPVAKSISMLPKNLKTRLNIHHQSTAEDLQIVKDIYTQNNIKSVAKAFFDNVPELLNQSHLFIGRSGANTVLEIITVARPAIFIPLIHKDKQQVINAEISQKIGGSIIILQSNSLIDNLTETIKSILSDEKKLKTMHENLKKISIPVAIPNLIKVVEKYMENKNAK